MTQPKHPPRIYVYHEWRNNWDNGAWSIAPPITISNNYEVYEYISLSEHQALLAEARALAFEEAARLMVKFNLLGRGTIIQLMRDKATEIREGK